MLTFTFNSVTQQTTINEKIDSLYDLYLHSLIAHVPDCFEVMDLHNLSTERGEGFFAFMKHVLLRLTGRDLRNEQVLREVLIRFSMGTFTSRSAETNAKLSKLFSGTIASKSFCSPLSSPSFLSPPLPSPLSLVSPRFSLSSFSPLPSPLSSLPPLSPPLPLFPSLSLLSLTNMSLDHEFSELAISITQSNEADVNAFLRGLCKWNYRKGKDWQRVGDEIRFVTLFDTLQVFRGNKSAS
mgnify:CR=1 FL=1